MTRKLVVFLLLLTVVFVGPRRIYGAAAEVVAILWNKVTGSVEELEDSAERSLRKAVEAARTLAADRAAAEEAAAMARVERDQARRELEKVKAEKAMNVEAARAVLGALREAETMGKDRFLVDDDGTARTPAVELDRAQARDVLEAARQRIEYLTEQARVQEQTVQRTTALAADWEKRAGGLAMASSEARQSGDLLRIYRREEQARKREDALRGGLLTPVDRDSRLEEVRRGLAVEQAKRGFAATEATTGAGAIYRRMVDARDAERKLGSFYQALDHKGN